MLWVRRKKAPIALFSAWGLEIAGGDRCIM